MPVRDLDADWATSRPPIHPNDLTFTFMGETLRRLPEVPLVAFITLEASTMGENETLTVLTAIRECIDPDSRDMWDTIVGRVANGDEPAVMPREGVTIGRVMQVWRYLVEAGSGRPTEQASDSSSGRLPTGTTSMDGSPPLAAAILRPSEPGGSPTLPITSGATAP